MKFILLFSLISLQAFAEDPEGFRSPPGMTITLWPPGQPLPRSIEEMLGPIDFDFPASVLRVENSGGNFGDPDEPTLDGVYKVLESDSKPIIAKIEGGKWIILIKQ